LKYATACSAALLSQGTFGIVDMLKTSFSMLTRKSIAFVSPFPIEFVASGSIFREEIYFSSHDLILSLHAQYDTILIKFTSLIFTSCSPSGIGASPHVRASDVTRPKSCSGYVKTSTTRPFLPSFSCFWHGFGKRIKLSDERSEDPVPDEVLWGIARDGFSIYYISVRHLGCGTSGVLIYCAIYRVACLGL